MHPAITLLRKLIETQSFSRQEENTAQILEDHLRQHQVEIKRVKNNLIAHNKHFDPDKPTILLNSHHDTVRPNTSYTRNPYEASIEDDKLYGLGSNDAGGCLVSLLHTFLHYFSVKNLRYNLVFAATAEEEIAGKDGMLLCKEYLPKISFAIVGEPTLMQMAIAEKGLMVLDCTAHGISGHAAREEGENALYKAMEDIRWFQQFEFPKLSETLGKVKTSVTMIEAGTQHNVVPDVCKFVVDVRVTDAYSNAEVLEIVGKHLNSEFVPRSTNLHSSSIPVDHPIVQAGIKLGLTYYGSPTMSDQARLTCPSLKIGPGDSARSHSADEFIYVSEIQEGIKLYQKLLDCVLF